jgi:hypothetical protein
MLALIEFLLAVSSAHPRMKGSMIAAAGFTEKRD